MEDRRALLETEHRTEQALRKFVRAVDEAGDWFMADDVTPYMRTKQATSIILRALNKIHATTAVPLDILLADMYILHVGRRSK